MGGSCLFLSLCPRDNLKDNRVTEEEYSGWDQCTTSSSLCICKSKVKC